MAVETTQQLKGTLLCKGPGLGPSSHLRWVTTVIPAPGDMIPSEYLYAHGNLYARGAQKLCRHSCLSGPPSLVHLTLFSFSVSFHFLFLFCFLRELDNVSLCSHGWPRTHYVDEAGLDLW